MNIIAGAGPDIAGLYGRLPQLGSNNAFTASNSFVAFQWLTNPTNGNILIMDATGVMSSVAPSSMPAATPTVVGTNWTDNMTYTNSTGRTIYVWGMCKLTPAIIAGNAGYALISPTVMTNIQTAPSLLALLIPAQTNAVFGWIPNGKSFYFTNVSSGVGNTATTVGSGQYVIQ